MLEQQEVLEGKADVNQIYKRYIHKMPLVNNMLTPKMLIPSEM